jgi:hypothetical protein
MRDAGMSMPPLVFWIPMPTYDDTHRNRKSESETMPEEV